MFNKFDLSKNISWRCQFLDTFISEIVIKTQVSEFNLTIDIKVI